MDGSFAASKIRRPKKLQLSSDLKLSGRVPDLHVDVLLVEHGLVLVHLGDLGRVVVDEPTGHVTHDQR